MESGRSRSAAHIASVEHSFCTICSAECLIRVTEPPIDRHKPTDRACPPEMGRFKDQKSMESSQETQLFCFFFLARIALTRRFILLICRHGPGNCNCGALDRHGHRLDSVNSRSRKGSRTPRNDTSPCVARWRVVRTCRSSCHHRCRSRFGCSTCCGGCSDQCSACRRSIVPGVCGLGYCDVARPRARALRMWIEVPSAIQPRGCCSRHISRFFWIWPLSSCRLCGKV